MDKICPKAHNAGQMDHLNRQLKQLTQSGLSTRFIAEYLNIPVERVERAFDGIYESSTTMRRSKATTRESTAKAQKPRLVPVTRPFPILEGLNDGDRIIALTKHGMAASKILRYVSKNITVKQINAYATKKLGAPRVGNNSRDNDITPSFEPYVHECLLRLGKNRYVCEICLDPAPKGCVIHHTRYNMATVYDLMYVCQSCNLARENKGLD